MRGGIREEVAEGASGRAVASSSSSRPKLAAKLQKAYADLTEGGRCVE